MTDTPNTSAAELVSKLLDTRAKLAAVEDRWKELRAESRRFSLLLLEDHGYSVNKVSLLSGHHRNTLQVWLDAGGTRRTR